MGESWRRLGYGVSVRAACRKMARDVPATTLDARTTAMDFAFTSILSESVDSWRA